VLTDIEARTSGGEMQVPLVTVSVGR
jgi:hypothetical protein